MKKHVSQRVNSPPLHRCEPEAVDGLFKGGRAKAELNVYRDGIRGGIYRHFLCSDRLKELFADALTVVLSIHKEQNVCLSALRIAITPIISPFDMRTTERPVGGGAGT